MKGQSSNFKAEGAKRKVLGSSYWVQKVTVINSSEIDGKINKNRSKNSIRRKGSEKEGDWCYENPISLGNGKGKNGSRYIRFVSAVRYDFLLAPRFIEIMRESEASFFRGAVDCFGIDNPEAGQVFIQHTTF